MKKIFALYLILLPIFTFAQDNSFQIDSCGISNNDYLNQHEVKYFNNLVPAELDFDFANKKVAFINEHDTTTVINKEQYFLNYGKMYYYDNNHTDHSIVVLTNEERARTGFDVVVITLPQSKNNGHSRTDLLRKIER